MWNRFQPGSHFWATICRLFPAVALFGTVFVVYSGVYGHTFLPNWDDYEYVLNNESIRGFSFENIKKAFTSYYVGNYAPVQIISYMFDYALWDLKPGGYLFGNVLFHGANGVLFYYLLVRFRLGSYAAFLAAFIFVTHPIQVESVAWVAQRKNVLAMVFFLAAFHLYLSYRDGTRRSNAYYFSSIIALILSLLSKPVMVLFPIVVTLYDFCFPDQKERTFGRYDKIPYLIVAVIACILAMSSQSQGNAGGRRDFPGGGAMSAVLTMLPVLTAYIKDCLIPIDLSPYYRIPIRNHLDGTVIVSAVMFLLMILGGIVCYRKSRLVLFFYVFFFIALIPVMQIIPIAPLKQDRYLYFPLVGFAGVSGSLFHLAWQRFPKMKAVTALVALLYVIPLPVLSYKQVTVWENDIRLWEYALEKDKDNLVGWLLLMKGYTRVRNHEKAAKALERYLALESIYGPPRGWEHP